MGDDLERGDFGNDFVVTALSGGSLGDHSFGLIEFENRGDDVDEMGDHLPFVDGYDYTANPTEGPSSGPTVNPSLSPSATPSLIPSAIPSSIPSSVPTAESMAPTSD